MPGRLDGKIAVVTGSSNGIGRAISLLFAKEGATIICSDLDSATRGSDQSSTHEAIKQAGGKSTFIKANVTVEADVAHLVEEASQQYGRIDIMCNNAGIANQPEKALPIWDFAEEDWDLIMNINAKGVFLGCKHAIKIMKEQEPGPTGARGWILNTASIMSLIAIPNIVGYVASKHCVAGITKVAALDSAPYRIQVNAVCPGFIATDMTSPYKGDKELYERLNAMHPLKGFGQAEDIARTCLFLCSPDNTNMTGSLVTVDGGYTAL